MRSWVLAFFPILANVLPVKEFMWEELGTAISREERLSFSGLLCF